MIILDFKIPISTKIRIEPREDMTITPVQLSFGRPPPQHLPHLGHQNMRVPSPPKVKALIMTSSLCLLLCSVKHVRKVHC